MVARPSSPPLYSDTYWLITEYVYNVASGRLEIVDDPLGVRTKTFYDDLGRQTFVAENQYNFEGAGDESDIGGGTNNDQDRVTKWEYNGLNEVAKLRAYNGSSSSYQDTDYAYLDSYNASLVTNTIYPDASVRTPVSQTALPPFDQVRMVYNLDGKPATMTDQRGVVHTYTYDNARRLSLDGATTIPTSVYGGSSEADAVRSIARTYTDLGEPDTITSYSTDDGTGTTTIQNQISYEYQSTRRVDKIWQSHQGAVTSGTPVVDFTNDTVSALDTSSSVYVYTANLHRISTYYPVASSAHLEVYFGNITTITGRLHRPRYEKLWGGDLNSNTARTFFYEYNGVNRLAGISDNGNYLYSPGVKRLMYSASGNYDSFDRFGRTIKQKWRNYSGSVTFDEINYTYDSAGNREWREDVQAAANSKDHDESQKRPEKKARKGVRNEWHLNFRNSLRSQSFVFVSWSLQQGL